MTVLVFGIAFVSVLLAYAYMSLCVNKTFVQCVEAGPTDSITAECLKKKSVYLRNNRMVDCQGHDLNPEIYFRVKVNGNCLSKRQIVDGDILIVKRILNVDSSSLHTGDIVLLYIQDTGVYKIREVVSVNDDNIRTKYYLNDGSEQESSKLHNASQVKGVVRFKL